MAVVKTRASQHDTSLRQFLIGPAGITLADPVQPPGDLRTAHRDPDLPYAPAHEGTAEPFTDPAVGNR